MEIKLFGDKWLEPGSIEDLANRIFKCAVVGANELRRATDKPVSRPAWLSIMFEYAFFYLALIRRHSWADLPAGQQEALTAKASDVLLNAVVDYIFEEDGTASNADRVEHFKGELAARLKAYGEFSLMTRASEAEAAEGTALWAFCNKVSALAGSPRDVGCVMTAHAHIYDSMFAIGIHTTE